MLNCPRCDCIETVVQASEPLAGSRLAVTMWCPVCDWAFEIIVPTVQTILDAIKASIENAPPVKP